MLSSDAESNLSIGRAAGRLRWAVVTLIAVMLALYAAARFELRLGDLHIAYGQHGPAERSRLVSDMGMVLLVIALARLTQMLAAIAGGELFSSPVIRLFRSFAFWLLLKALAGLVVQIIAELLAHDAASPFRLIIDFRQVLTVGVTLLLFLLARLLERARGLDEEVREFV